MARNYSAAAVAVGEPGEADRYKTPTDEDPVLAAFGRAPFVGLSEFRRKKLEEAERRHTHWVSTEEFMAKVRDNIDQR